MVVAGFFLRYSLITYNLPVTSRIDERIGLEILYRFESGSLNPEFFDWPTFYYYLTYFVTKPFIGNFQEIILYGRFLNILLGCFLIIVVFFLAKFSFRSEEVGLIAAFLAAFSSILIGNGSYMSTDILLTIFSLLALLFFILFSKEADYKYWFLGVLMTGFALTTKYTAVLVIATYLLLEIFFFRNPADLKDGSNNLLEKQFPLWWLSMGALAVGILGLAFYFFPRSILFCPGLINKEVLTLHLIPMNLDSSKALG